MGLIEHSGEPWGVSNRELQRARATTGYDFVSLQRDEMRAERDEARQQLRGAVSTALDAMQADAQRRLDAGDAPKVAQADLDALARVRRLHGGQ